MSDIFLSYSSKDRERIRPLEKALEAQGWTVFWDREIPVGKSWRSFIGQEIQNCLSIVVVWTQNSVESEWVIEEAEEGKSRGILFPVNLDNIKPPFGFGSIQSADLTDWNEDNNQQNKHKGYRLLINELGNHIGTIKKQQQEKEKLEAEKNRIIKKEQQERREAAEQARLEKERQELKRIKAEQVRLEKEQQKKRQAETKKQHQQAVASEMLTKEKIPDPEPTIKGKILKVALPVLLLGGLGGVFFYQNQQQDNVNPSNKSETTKSELKNGLTQQTDNQFKQVTHKTRIELPNKLTLLALPKGEFIMGDESSTRKSEKPAHKVTIRPFWMGETEITFNQYDAYTKEKGLKLADDEGWGRDNRPVINVSWNDTQGYLKWLNKKYAKQLNGLKCRLPTEAEWEYAARAGTKTQYYWGDEPSHDYANYGKEECCSGLAKGKDQWKNTAPVASFPPNKFGLYDMSGNVDEWVEDKWHNNYQGAPADGSAWLAGGSMSRVFRGGSWLGTSNFVRSAIRFGYVPDDRLNYIGFRIVCALIH